MVALGDNGGRRPETIGRPAMLQPDGATMSFKPNLPSFANIVLVVALVAILAAAGWFAAQAWVSVSGPPMPEFGYVAMALGVVFSVGLGCGLMALLFYSSRHGYDEPPHAGNDGE